jgi:hypothetical protein
VAMRRSAPPFLHGARSPHRRLRRAGAGHLLRGLRQHGSLRPQARRRRPQLPPLRSPHRARHTPVPRRVTSAHSLADRCRCCCAAPPSYSTSVVVGSRECEFQSQKTRASKAVLHDGPNPGDVLSESCLEE